MDGSAEVQLAMAEEKGLEVEKLALLKKAAGEFRNLTDRSSEIHFEIAGVVGSLTLAGEGKARSENFLRSYLSPFPLKSKKDPHFRIHLTHPEGPHSRPEHPVWNTFDQELHMSRETSGELIAHQRDFVARLSVGQDWIEAYGPEINERSIDTIDNLLNCIISRHLPPRSALAVHAATIERKGYAFVFFGASGAGKSTLSQFCYQSDGLRILSADQIYLKYDSAQDRVFAHPTSVTIPDFPRSHPGWCGEPKEVKALIHLVQKGELSFVPKRASELLPLFLRETIYQPYFERAAEILDISISLTSAKRLSLGELSYPKGVSFWDVLDKNSG